MNFDSFLRCIVINNYVAAHVIFRSFSMPNVTATITIAARWLYDYYDVIPRGHRRVLMTSHIIILSRDNDTILYCDIDKQQYRLGNTLHAGN